MPTNNFTESHAKIIDTLFNKYVRTYPDADYDTFLVKSPFRKMFKYIDEDSVGIGSKKQTLFAIARFFEVENVNKAKFKQYITKAQELREELDTQEAQNTQTEKEKIAYRDHDFLLNVVSKYDIEESDFKKNIKQLALALTVLHPPVRSDFYVTSQIIFQKADDDKVHNFIFVNRRTKKIMYIINNDKVTKTRSYAMKPALKNIEIKDKKLKAMINYSVTNFPRKHTLQTKEGQQEKPISQKTLNEYFRSETGSVGFTTDTLRSSYINWFYRLHKAHAKREVLAHQMRHSVMTSLIYYFKDLDADSDKEKVDATPEAIETLENDNILLEGKLEMCEDSKNIDKQYKKRRYDLIYSLNKKGSAPKNSTIDRYAIQFNDETNKYF
jgi:hypothetical protein